MLMLILLHSGRLDIFLAFLPMDDVYFFASAATSKIHNNTLVVTNN